MGEVDHDPMLRRAMPEDLSAPLSSIATFIFRNRFKSYTRTIQSHGQATEQEP